MFSDRSTSATYYSPLSFALGRYPCIAYVRIVWTVDTLFRFFFV